MENFKSLERKDHIIERYKLDKNIENQKVEIQIFYKKYKPTRIKMRELLDERKAMASRCNEIDYHEEEIRDFLSHQDPHLAIH